MGSLLQTLVTDVQALVASGLGSLAVLLGVRFRSHGALPGSFTRVPNLPDWARVRARLDAEVARARRYEHDVSIVVLSFEPHAAAPGEETNEAFLAQTELLLRRTVRENDVVTCDPELRRLVLALPETRWEGAMATGQRLRKVLEPVSLFPVRVGAAAFPGDGLILDDLVACAAGDPAPRPRPLEC